MTKRDRVQAALRGDAVDRPPVCFWHHFQPGGSGYRLAEATYDFFVRRFDLDIAKLMPDLRYPFPRRSIAGIEDWYLVDAIDFDRARYAVEWVRAVRRLRQLAGPDVPIVVTVFSPLAQALYFVARPEILLQHHEERPALVHDVLRILAENVRRHIELVLEAGADGVFFALQGCSASVMSRERYRELGRPYDLFALSAAADGWLNVLHVHGDRELFFDDVLDYPVQVLSWSDRRAGPSLREARQRTDKCLMGGWDEFGALAHGPVEAIRAEARDAVEQTTGRRFILANGCSVPDDTDERWLAAARRAVEELT
ncbi:MAG: uroporphyrinogen decarboxylase family protein [Thermomicrobium sp.]|nr:uroporphyrinogen decarboxylase [Thermomicrobium sp.]MDW8059432.1 uroporphyrinogen decarboxylase family protein [Thermomicrobium sp.]